MSWRCRSGSPATTRRGCWPRSSTIRCWSRPSKWMPGVVTSTTGRSATRLAHLFDRTPHAWKKLAAWAKSKDEFVRRAAFALLASLSVHDKQAEDALFVRGLALVERAAEDERNIREEGRELGAAQRRQAQRGAARQGRGGVGAAGRVPQPNRALVRQGRAARALGRERRPPPLTPREEKYRENAEKIGQDSAPEGDQKRSKQTARG